jgi:hypothetical protein
MLAHTSICPTHLWDSLWQGNAVLRRLLLLIGVLGIGRLVVRLFDENGVLLGLYVAGLADEHTRERNLRLVEGDARLKRLAIWFAHQRAHLLLHLLDLLLGVIDAVVRAQVPERNVLFGVETLGADLVKD